MEERIKGLLSREPSEEIVKAEGWVRTKRDSKNVCFLEINDGSCLKGLQAVIDKAAFNNNNLLDSIATGASVVAKGKIVKSQGGDQAVELLVEDLELVGECPNDYPLQKKRHSIEFLREKAYLRPRTNLFGAITRVRNTMSYAVHQFFQENGFVYVNTPIITASDCEGAGQQFQVTTLDLENVPKTEDGKVDYSKDFFGKIANLTVSGQLSAETYAMAFANVYTFGPTFRAERSNTARHAAEFWMMEPEIAFADLKDDMRLAEDMIKYVVKYVMQECPKELEFFNNFVDKTLLDRLNNLVSNDFGHVTYTEAIEILEKSGKKFDYPVKWGIDLQTEHERYITEEVFGKPVFVTDYPADIKAFYMRLNDDGKTVAAMDMLVPGVGELIGGSQREERLDYLLKAMEKFNLNEEDYWWYLELRKYGGTKHAGFGLGFERLIMYITGVANIRDVESYPRTTGSAEF